MHEAVTPDDIGAFLHAHEHKEMVRFVVVGSVDDGKSSLIGRLLFDTGSLFDDQLSQVRRASKMAGTEIDFSLFTDGLLSEREQGITIDVAYRYFSTVRRKFIIADTPGHAQYTRNMATGASAADIAVTLLDARLGVLPQTCRHATIASIFGIRHLVVAVNKMDLCGGDEKVFASHCEALRKVLSSLSFESVSFVPVSAVTGDNIVNAGGSMPWYSGPTLLSLLETLPVARDVVSAPFRFPVQTVLRPSLDYRGYAGRVESGRIQKGDVVTVLPSRKTSRVVGIDTFSGEIDEAFAPLSVVLRLADELDVGRGDMIVHPGALPVEGDAIDAMVVWMGDEPLSSGKSYFMKQGASWGRVLVSSIVYVQDLDTQGTLEKASMVSNDIGRVELRTLRKIAFDTYASCRKTGAFVLVDSLTNDTVGAGMILGVTQAADGVGGAQVRGSVVTASERRERLGHPAMIVPVSGATRGEALAIAYAAERLLFDRRVLVTVVGEGEGGAASALAAAGLFVLVPEALSDSSAFDEKGVAAAASALVRRLVAGGL